VGHSDSHDHVIGVHDHHDQNDQNEKRKKQRRKEKEDGVVRNHQVQTVINYWGDPHEDLDLRKGNKKKEMKREKVCNYRYM